MTYCSIREAAAKCNMTELTLRYYEKKGLLPLIERDEASRRLFSEDQMPLLEIVICLPSKALSNILIG
ncbi:MULTISPECIES: MerR family transcriptional regulator [Bacillus amyloliquefaciens group]|uniref:MerR family transcriptional regulator n=1 Tax=Bacillus amyloliquefaciens group TaxID=1938374 RepID=UPI001F1069AC|nr:MULTISPECIES: MerR family transcriptional regulator [Bacillus amyloliquefaciens group]MCR4365895.1 MerR family DNA-binding transcriptional regulator [Bacillus amyloliquefaciens]MCV3199336.1 MerR family DNA-binding transcriptional regulator [Bacillus velezensis]MDP1502977.1 MerR family DNA-binding transcriptional regulator [Bacillus velezensis]MDP1506836.1 MerR family DNA-binding transcriptional regulator [Bacillus velezensis]MEC1509911.1 MerR family DNA-binding transcriptional regulator [Ba